MVFGCQVARTLSELANMWVGGGEGGEGRGLLFPGVGTTGTHFR